MTSERRNLAVVVGTLVFVSLWSAFYTTWRLPPQLPFGTFGLVLGGDVLPLLAVPLAVARFVLGGPLSDFGWKRPAWRDLLADTGSAWLAVAPLVVWLAMRPEFQAFYPSTAFPPAREHAIGLAFLWLLHHAPQLLALEFCYRGFALLPLARRFGVGFAVAPLLAWYVALHWGKPTLELVLAAWAGLVFSLVAWRSRSFWPAFLAHWLVAVTMDLLCFVWGRTPG
ncbi:MAG: CPBP family glutamic-type intramembrane protease [Myxococcota bacterium]